MHLSRDVAQIRYFFPGFGQGHSEVHGARPDQHQLHDRGAGEQLALLITQATSQHSNSVRTRNTVQRCSRSRVALIAP